MKLTKCKYASENSLPVLLLFFAFQVWNLTNCKLKINHFGHTGYLNTVTVSPDGSLCASGGKVKLIFCWNFKLNLLALKQWSCIFSKWASRSVRYTDYKNVFGVYIHIHVACVHPHACAQHWSMYLCSIFSSITEAVFTLTGSYIPGGSLRVRKPIFYSCYINGCYIPPQILRNYWK
jgi:hypothetical protein